MSSFSSVWGMGPSASMQFFQCSSQILLALARIDLAGPVWLRLSSAHQSPIVLEEKMSSSRTPLAKIPAWRLTACCRGRWMPHFAGCAFLLVQSVVLCWSYANSVHFLKFVQFSLPCWLGWLPVHSVSSGHWGQVPSFSSVHLFHFMHTSGSGALFCPIFNLVISHVVAILIQIR